MDRPIPRKTSMYRSYEDFRPGDVILSEPRAVPADEIVAFAEQFDPQPMHLGPEGAAGSMLGAFIASGWHMCAVAMRLICDSFLLQSSSMGSGGIERTEWRAPMRPGDVVRLRTEVIETRLSRSRPEIGLVRFRFELLNQRAETLLLQTNWIMFRRREAGADAIAAA